MAREQPGRPKQSPLGPQFEALEPRDWALDKDVEALASARANKPTSAETRRLGSELFDEFLFLALLASLGLAPLSFVSNASFNWREIAVFFAILATLYEFGLLISGRSRPVAARRLWFPALAFALVCVRLLAQLGPAAAAADPPSIWGTFLATLGSDFSGVSSSATMIALLQLVACALIFWISMQLCRSSDRAQRLVEAVTIIGTFTAAYGIIGFFIFSDTIRWFDRGSVPASVIREVIDRKSYATYAGIGLVAALSLAMRFYSNLMGSNTASWGRKAMALMAMTTGAGGAWLACAIVIAIALLLTGSRGGIVAAIGGIITLALLLSVRRRPNSVALASGLSLAMLAIGVILFNLNDAIFRLVLPAAWGQNNHHLVDWDKTQNTYLALFQNLGIPFAAIFLTGLVFLAGRCAAAALTRERSAIAPLVASAAVLIVALHSLVNLSVQNSALSLMWAALLGAGVAQSWSSRVLTQR